MPALPPPPSHEYYENLPGADAAIALPTVNGVEATASALSEKRFEDAAKPFFEAYDKLYASLMGYQKKAMDNTSQGHGEVRKVASWAEWFTKLMNWTASINGAWTTRDENAHRLLYHYARWKITAAGTKPLYSTVEYMMRYLGKSVASYTAAGKYRASDGKPVTTTADLLGNGTGWWCGPASTIPISALYKRWELKMKDDRDPSGKWGQKCNVITSESGGPDGNIDVAPMEAGDILFLLGTKTPPSGHVATVITSEKYDPKSAAGATVLMISGNAGGGSVRINEVKRVPPPEGYNYSAIAHSFNKVHYLDEDIGKVEKLEKKYDDSDGELKEEKQGLKDQRDAAQQKYDAAKGSMPTNPTVAGTIWVVRIMRTSKLALPPFNSKDATFKSLSTADLDAYLDKWDLDFERWEPSRDRTQRAIDAAKAAKDAKAKQAAVEDPYQ